MSTNNEEQAAPLDEVTKGMDVDIPNLKEVVQGDDDICET